MISSCWDLVIAFDFSFGFEFEDDFGLLPGRRYFDFVFSSSLSKREELMIASCKGDAVRRIPSIRVWKDDWS